MTKRSRRWPSSTRPSFAGSRVGPWASAGYSRRMPIRGVSRSSIEGWLVALRTCLLRSKNNTSQVRQCPTSPRLGWKSRPTLPTPARHRGRRAWQGRYNASHDEEGNHRGRCPFLILFVEQSSRPSATTSHVQNESASTVSENVTIRDGFTLAALAAASGRPACEVAAVAGVCERTIRRWNRRDDFQAMVRRLRDSMLSDAQGRLLATNGKAIDALAGLLGSG